MPTEAEWQQRVLRAEVENARLRAEHATLWAVAAAARAARVYARHHAALAVGHTRLNWEELAGRLDVALAALPPREEAP